MVDRIKAIDIINEFIFQLEDMKKDARKFDERNDIAGERLRKAMLTTIKYMKQYRKEIQRIRYYRDAWNVFYGKKKYIGNKKVKEKRYGSVNKVAKFQITQKFRA